MADLIIDGTTYNGRPTAPANPYRPSSLKRSRLKIGKLLIAADGTPTWMHRGFKWQWEIGWEKASQVTEAAVLALRNKTTTFALTDYNGTTYTVLTAGDDTHEEDITTDSANTYLFGLAITLREA
jgi:hypothetical protein